MCFVLFSVFPLSFWWIQRSLENPHEDARQSKTVPVYGLQQRLQHGGRANVAHAEPSQTGCGTGQLATDIRPVVQVPAVHTDIPQARRATGR